MVNSLRLRTIAIGLAITLAIALLISFVAAAIFSLLPSEEANQFAGANVQLLEDVCENANIDDCRVLITPKNVSQLPTIAEQQMPEVLDLTPIKNFDELSQALASVKANASPNTTNTETTNPVELEALKQKAQTEPDTTIIVSSELTPEQIEEISEAFSNGIIITNNYSGTGLQSLGAPQ